MIINTNEGDGTRDEQRKETYFFRRENGNGRLGSDRDMVGSGGVVFLPLERAPDGLQRGLIMQEIITHIDRSSPSFRGDGGNFLLIKKTTGLRGAKGKEK